MSVEFQIKENISLDQYTTFKIGGKAKYFFEIKTKSDLLEIFNWAEEKNEEIFILGGGSNVLVNDKGVDGIVLVFANKDIVIRGERIECGGGASLSRTASMAMAANLCGLEWGVGIPGATIAGAIVGNAGAFSSNISDCLENTEVFNVEKKRFELFSKKDCLFDYRQSIFKGNSKYIIFNAIFKLSRTDSEKIKELVEKMIEYRNKTQPKLPNAGSIFKNIDFKYLFETNKGLADHANDRGVVINGSVPAGWLIDQAGLKGKTIGGAKISLEHANFIVNTSKASSEDVVMLISFIKQKIRVLYNIQLQEEVQYFGY